MIDLTKLKPPTSLRWRIVLPVLVFIGLALFPYGVVANHVPVAGYVVY